MYVILAIVYILLAILGVVSTLFVRKAKAAQDALLLVKFEETQALEEELLLALAKIEELSEVRHENAHLLMSISSIWSELSRLDALLIKHGIPDQHRDPLYSY